MPEARFVRSFEDLGSRPFVLFVGAGISIWHPSSLPTWREFNVALLEAAKEHGRSVLPVGEPPFDDIWRLTIDDVGSKAVSHAVVETLGPVDYFETVRKLDSEQPNPVHLAIARLVARGTVRAVVTTNFDTLIERALAQKASLSNCSRTPPITSTGERTRPRSTRSTVR